MEKCRTAAWRRWLAHRLQGAALYALYGLFGLLPVDRASALVGVLGRILGPRLGASRKAERSLALVMPELDAAARRTVIRRM